MISLGKFGKRGSRLFGAGLILAWAAAFAFLVWPALRDNQDDELRIEDMDRRIELLSGWNEGRRHLTVDPDAWSRELNQRFDGMFPKERRLQELFYEIAAAANRSDVDPVKISVKNPSFAEEMREEIPSEDMGNMGDGMGEGVGGESLHSSLGLSAAEFPDDELESHRLAVQLDAGYENIARFLDEVSQLERAVTVNKLNLQQGGRGVVAMIELEYYVQATN
jgi:hypothetical protein